MSLRETILQAQDLASEPVDVPEWRVTVTVRQMPEVQRVAFDLWNSEQVKAGATDYSVFRCRLLAECCCDETGVAVFSADDVPALQQKSPTAVDRLASVALRLNHMRNEDLEGAEKNSGSASGSDSSTDSPCSSATSTST